MKVWNFAPALYEGLKESASGLCEGPKNCIRIVWGSEQFASGFVWRSEQVPSGFHAGLSNFHQDFMKVWTISIRISWRSRKMHHDFMMVWKKLHQDCMKVWSKSECVKTGSGCCDGKNNKKIKKEKKKRTNKKIKKQRNKKRKTKKNGKNNFAPTIKFTPSGRFVVRFIVLIPL